MLEAGVRRAACLLAAFWLLGAAEPADDEREVRRQQVGDWTVTEIAESDGGRRVELQRAGQLVQLDYMASYWRGNGGVMLSAEISLASCQYADPATPLPFGTDETTTQLRARFHAALGQCSLSRLQQERLLGEIDRPHCLFRRWAAEVAAATINENAEIAAYGSGAAPARVQPTYPDCRV